MADAQLPAELFEPDPASTILRVADQEKVDIIVVGNVGMGRRRQFLLGKFAGLLLASLAMTAALTWVFEWVLVFKPYIDKLSADISDRGIVLTGGGGLLKNLDKRIREETGLPVSIAEDPLASVVLGTGRMLTDFDLLRRVAIE